MVSIVSLAWNKYDLTKEFLQRLKKFTDIDYELVFTDNGSEEPISDLVREFYPDVKLIRHEKNIGCPATRNPSMEVATGDIVFWLDNDTYVDAGWYKPFLTELENEKTGIVGIEGRRVVNPFNPEAPWEMPGQFLPDRNVDWFVGFAIAFRKKAYKPIPDWNLMVNLDDVDVSLGVKTSGYKAKMISTLAPLRHLVTQTGAPVMPTREEEVELFKRWWKYWEPMSETFENYK